MTEREALMLALKAMKQIDEVTPTAMAKLIIPELEQVLAQPEQEPVAWVSSEELLVMRGNALGGAKDWRINVGLVKQNGDVGLYTTPPQRKPLTDEEIWDEVKAADLDWQTGWSLDEDASNRYITFARAIEAAHGIKGEA